MIKELFSANDVKLFRDYIFDMILHAYVEKHEGIMNNIINNNTDLVYTINEDERAKEREELENKDKNDDKK